MLSSQFIAMLGAPSAASGSSSGAPTPYLGLVASRCRMYSGSFGPTNVTGMGRSAHFATENLTSIKIAFANWDGSNPDTSLGGTLSIRASVEFPAGTFTQILFSGSVTGSVLDKATVFSDFASVSIPNGSLFWIRIWTSGTVGVYANTFQNAFLGEGWNTGPAVADQTLGGTVSSGFAFSMPPLAILGMTTNPSVIIYGDSIGAGQNDVEDTSASNSGRNCKIGVIARSLGLVPFLNLSITGMRVQDFATNAVGKRNILGFSSHLISQMGINDLSNAQTSAQLIANLQVPWNVAKGVNPLTKVFQTTITPKSGSTDAWATTVNQTPDATITASRATFNNAVRATLAGAAGSYDLASVFETAQNNDIWLASPTPPYTPDGLHPTLSGYALVPPSGIIAAPSYP